MNYTIASVRRLVDEWSYVLDHRSRITRDKPSPIQPTGSGWRIWVTKEKYNPVVDWYTILWRLDIKLRMRINYIRRSTVSFKYNRVIEATSLSWATKRTSTWKSSAEQSAGKLIFINNRSGMHGNQQELSSFLRSFQRREKTRRDFVSIMYRSPTHTHTHTIQL
jgi:hypothetical protein